MHEQINRLRTQDFFESSGHPLEKSITEKNFLSFTISQRLTWLIPDLLQKAWNWKRPRLKKKKERIPLLLSLVSSIKVSKRCGSQVTTTNTVLEPHFKRAQKQHFKMKVFWESMLKFQLVPEHTSLYQLRPRNDTTGTIFKNNSSVGWWVCLSTRESGGLLSSWCRKYFWVP